MYHKVNDNIIYHINPYDIICVIDFEATCDNYAGRKPPRETIQEIIEFPAFVVDVKSKSIISTFHEYVKPQINPKLSSFCNKLTGITQHMVDKADLFPKVLERFEKQLSTLIKKKKYKSFAIATDGPWDIAHFLARQCQINEIEFPEYAKRWINVKKMFANHYQTSFLSLDVMLTSLGIKFEGRRHSGYYDALHITKLLLRMLMDGAVPWVNEMVSWEIESRKCWGDLVCGYVPCDPLTIYCL